MIHHRRIQALEREVKALPLPTAELQEDAFSVWVEAGCVGPLPEAGPLPEHLRRKFRTQEDWERSRRFVVALCCRSVGRDDPPGMDDEERCEVEDMFRMYSGASQGVKSDTRF